MKHKTLEPPPDKEDSPYMGIVLGDLKAEIRRLSIEEDRTMSAVLRTLIKEALNARKLRVSND